MTNAKDAASSNMPERVVPRRPTEVDKYIDTFLSVVCDTSRRSILELLAISDEDDEIEMPEKRSGDIARAIGLSAATTSEHLRQLAKIDIVKARRDRNVIYYQLRDKDVVKAFQNLLSALDSDYAQYMAKLNNNQEAR